MYLSDDEKFFVAHFVLGSNHVVKPVCGKYISLFSFLDQTDESIEMQLKQIDEDDWYFSGLLGKIYNQSDKSTWDSVFKELDREGFFDNENFYNKFLGVATWLFSKNSIRYFFEVQKEAGEIYSDLKRIQRLKDAQEKTEKDDLRKFHLRHLSLKSEQVLDQERVNAMKLLYKGSGVSKAVKSISKPAGDWGLKSRSKLVGDGSDWREQS